MWSNSLFEDDILLEGILTLPEGVSIVTSQPFIVGRSPTTGEIALWFESQGYISDGYNRWKHPSTGTTVADTHPGNLIVIESGEVIPIDLQILDPGEFRL